MNPGMSVAPFASITTSLPAKSSKFTFPIVLIKPSFISILSPSINGFE